MERSALVYCIECGSDRLYRIISSRVEATVRGTKFSYVQQTAVCSECGGESYVPEINDENVRAKEEAYRQASHLVTIAEINALMSKYDIGAGPLAKVLGFGDVTVNRYLSGQLPSRECSARILEALASHNKYNALLEANKNELSFVAYEKTRRAVDSLLSLYGTQKIELVTRYLLCNAGDITPLALQKILYYAQAFFHAIFHEVLFSDECQAWAYGPVYPDIYYKYNKFGYNPIEKPTEMLAEDFDELSHKEINLLDSIITSFGKYSGDTLSRFTHSEKPWLDARGSLLPRDRCVTVIKADDINSYFDDVVARYRIVNPCDIVLYSEHMLAVSR